MSYLRKLEEKLVNCPFDPNHKVKSGRLELHIMKCVRQHPGFDICPFDFAHRFKKEHMREHIENCSSRAAVQHLLPTPKVNGGIIFQHGDVRETPVHVGNGKFNMEDENWEED